ncbi:MAG: DnaJ domain-containing protein [Sphingomonas sp.]
MGDYYDILGVARDADDAAIKAAYRRLAAEHHPDMEGGETKRFQAIQGAYATLKDSEKRAYYDRTGSDAPRQRNEMEELVPLVAGAFDRAAVEALKGSGWGTPPGLGRTDMVKSMVRLLNDDKKRGIEANKQIAHEAERFREMLRRLGFKGEEGMNLIASVLAQRLRDTDEQTAKNEATIALVDRAIEHVELYGWEMDPAPEPMVSPYHFDNTYMLALMRKQFSETSMLGEIYQAPRPIPVMAPGTEIRHAPHRASPRRGAKMDPKTKRYVRPHTVTLDANGNQVPPPRGSWGEFERRVQAA